MQLKSFLLSSLALSLVGCQASVPLTSLPVTSLPAVSGMAPEAASPLGWGSVEVRVAWPRQVQSLPTITQTIVINAYGTLGTLVGTLTVKRPTGSNVQSSSELRLPASTYMIEALAYQETSPDRTSVPVAQGSQGNVIISTNIRKNLTLSLTAYQPSAGALSALYGGANSLFTIDSVRAFNHPASFSTDVTAWFNTPTGSWVQASASFLPRRMVDPVTGRIEMLDPEMDKLLVQVPTGITGLSGVYVESNGVKSGYLGGFTVVDNLGFEAQSVTRKAGESYGSTANSNIKGFSLNSNVAVPGNLSYPMLTWSSSVPSVAVVTTAGTVYAVKPGRTVITATTGNVSQSYEFIVTDSESTASVTVTAPVLGIGSVSVPVTMPAYSGTATDTVN